MVIRGNTARGKMTFRACHEPYHFRHARLGMRTNKSTITGGKILRQLPGLPKLVDTPPASGFIFSDVCLTRDRRSQTQGEVSMSGLVILYFEDQSDALRFALAAGSVMAGDGTGATDDLVQETTRVTRIRLDDAKQGKSGQHALPERTA
jgi:hypothetical protein